jgi:hypothetical protein
MRIHGACSMNKEKLNTYRLLVGKPEGREATMRAKM